MKSLVPLLYVATLLLPCSCIVDESSSADDVVTVGVTLPQFSVTMSDGTLVTSDSLCRTPSVVMFFHTGCSDCREALPLVQRLYDTYSPQGVSFAIISREEGVASVSAYWDAHAFTMPYSAQLDRTIYELFAYRRVPRIYISARGGVVCHIFSDNPVPHYAQLDDALSAMLANSNSSFCATFAQSTKVMSNP